MIKKFESFNNNKNKLKYWSFDIDDNLIYAPTKIHMEKKVGDTWVPEDVSTSKFAEVRNDKENWRIINNDPGEAFSEFRDFGKRGDRAFTDDLKEAIDEKKFGPSWKAFIKCLTNASIFSLITARGHEPGTLRKGVEYIIDNVLNEDEKFLLYSNCLKFAHLFEPGKEFDRIPKGKLSKTPLVKYYLDHCDYYGVSSSTFQKNFGTGNASNPEKAKELALDKFIDKCNKFGESIGAKSVSIGFSDDDVKNVEHVRKYFKEKKELSKYLLSHKLKLNLYKTSDRSIEGGEKSVFETSSTWGNGASTVGLESSVLPFTKWNNMTKRLYPSSPDSPTDDYHNQFKNELGQVEDLYKKKLISEKNWIQNAIKHPGALRRKLHKKPGQKITKKEIDSELEVLKNKKKLTKSDKKTKRQLNLAKTLRKFK